MRKIKTAMIGCGSIAQYAHMPAISRNPIAEVKYMVDIIPERAKALAEQFKVPNVAADFRDILGDREVEAVSICTPNDVHAPIAIECLDAGKNVLCEKPAAVSMETGFRHNRQRGGVRNLWRQPHEMDSHGI